LKWRINPEEIRQNWSVRDMRWFNLIEQAQALAAPQIEQALAEKRAKKRGS